MSSMAEQGPVYSAGLVCIAGRLNMVCPAGLIKGLCPVGLSKGVSSRAVSSRAEQGLVFQQG